MTHRIRIAGPDDDGIKEHSIPECEAKLGIKYLPSLAFKTPWTQRQIEKQCASILRRKLLRTDIRWLGVLHAEDLEKHTINDVYIRWIDQEFGYGLFAARDIAAWEYIGEYTGLVKRRHWISNNINRYCFRYPTAKVCFLPFTIDAQDQGNETRFINHHDDANCDTCVMYSEKTKLLHMCLRSIKKVAKDEQITYDYGDEYWQKRSKKLLQDPSSTL